MAVQRQSGSNSENNDANMVLLGSRMGGSAGFRMLIQDGMELVERSAAYLDGDGRADSKKLSRQLALVYATESMRLTTRLMQIAAWLLYQRAVNEGDMSRMDALAAKAKWRNGMQGLAAQTEVFEQLPTALQELCQHSLRIQHRIQHLEGLIHTPIVLNATLENPLLALHRQLRQAFDSK